jgi:hypothetical protein
MKPLYRIGALLVALAASCCGQVSGRTEHIVDAAKKFLATLDAKQRSAVLFAFDDAEQRKRWSNFPTGFVPRAGIRLKDMNEQQRSAAMNLLAQVLSPMGYEKVNQIRLADDDFKANGSRRGPRGGGPSSNANGQPPPDFNGPRPSPASGRPPGGRPPLSGDMFGQDLYYISFLGEPSLTAPWMLQFGGHHLALNITVAGSRGVLTPTLTGAQPATFTVNGKTVRPLGRESDKALALVNALDDRQGKEAVLPYRVADLVLGPGQDDKRIAPEGLKASAMSEKQRAMLLDLISEWSGILNEEAASARMAQMKADLNDTWFAWSGPKSFSPGTNITAYYRIQGPHLVIEYAPQNDEPANHIHTIYRDPTNDYGKQLAQR